MARKTTKHEKREYKRLKEHLEELEKKEAEQDRRELRKLSRKTGKDYFRYPDGRLGFTWARPFEGFGFGVDMDDPQTRKVMAKELRKWARYDLVDGRLELTEEGRKEMEAEKRAERERLPEWQKAKDFAPTKSGKYMCITESGFLKKKVNQRPVTFRQGVMAGEWLTDGSERVVYWLEE